MIQKAVQNDPDSAIARYNLGLVLLAQGYNNIEALREFREASYIDPTWVLPYLQQSFIHMKMQDYINAEQAAHTAIRLDSTHPTNKLSICPTDPNEAGNHNNHYLLSGASQYRPRA